MTLANWISLIRIFLAPVIYWLLTTGSFEDGRPERIYIAFILLIFAAITDVADGWVARARHEISELGKTLDPLGDKLVILSTLIALAVQWKFPIILVFIYLFKELIQIFAGVLLLKKYKRVIPANWWGKSSTIVFFTGFGLFFINNDIGIIIIGAAILLSMVAFYSYYCIYRSSEKEKREKSKAKTKFGKY